MYQLYIYISCVWRSDGFRIFVEAELLDEYDITCIQIVRRFGGSGQFRIEILIPLSCSCIWICRLSSTCNSHYCTNILLLGLPVVVQSLTFIVLYISYHNYSCWHLSYWSMCSSLKDHYYCTLYFVRMLLQKLSIVQFFVKRCIVLLHKQ